MSKNKNESVRYIYVRDAERSVLGFATHEAAKTKAKDIKEDETTKVRVRLRSRTGMYDVLVKTRREVKDGTKPELMVP